MALERRDHAAERRSVLRAACAATLWALGARTAAVWAQAQPMGPAPRLSLSHAEGGWWVAAQWPIELSAPLSDALARGVALHFSLQVQLIAPRWYWRDKVVAQLSKHYRLAFLPLAQRWRLSTQTDAAEPGSGLGLSSTFDSLGAALATLSRLPLSRLAEDADLSEAEHRVDLHFALDAEQLPKPLLIGALGQSDWHYAISVSRALKADAP